MKADFEKGTKVCSKCKRELPISEFCNSKTYNDGFDAYCKRCRVEYRKSEKVRQNIKKNQDKIKNTFGRRGHKRGNCSMMLRDYELTEEQLKRRNKNREYSGNKSIMTYAHGILVWYDNKLNNVSKYEYNKILSREYSRQKSCAIRGYVAKVKPSEHFLFDFDLEQMLKDGACYSGGKYKYYITKWWDGEIRHWTVNDGIWRK